MHRISAKLMVANGYRWYNPDWGRYTQSDPVGRRGEPHPYAYARGNPLLFFDRLGLESLTVCCNEWDKTNIPLRIGHVAELQSGHLSDQIALPPQRFSAYPTGFTWCGGHQAHGGGTPTTEYSNLGLGDCADACTRAHEQVHRDNCRMFGYDDPPFVPQYGMDDPDEAFGYLAEYGCLKQALFEGKVTVNVDPFDDKTNY